jgi:hypothetical protein
MEKNPPFIPDYGMDAGQTACKRVRAAEGGVSEPNNREKKYEVR